MSESTTTIVAGGRYKILNAKSGTALDLSATNGEKVCGWNFHGRENQIWEASEENGFWHFRNVGNGKYLALEPHQSLKDGLKVVGTNMRFNWHIWPDNKDPSTLRILTPEHPFNLDLSGHGNAAGGTPVELWGRWDGPNQTWKFYKMN
ncbi:carbohydrate-binding module family 13 protein [Ephemerocybe angulata]|uniref:Carbohydrate-binding module family 13 protein n=1 Tax=Ephemerocybe angulata TaxID=980116 RepID=A0A8H6HIT6_9AGAR|nr:carbohydrate-binding module family 13 protein [Tulosesus angulatus]